MTSPTLFIITIPATATIVHPLCSIWPTEVKSLHIGSNILQLILLMAWQVEAMTSNYVNLYIAKGECTCSNGEFRKSMRSK